MTEALGRLDAHDASQHSYSADMYSFDFLTMTPGRAAIIERELEKADGCDSEAANLLGAAVAGALPMSASRNAKETK